MELENREMKKRKIIVVFDKNTEVCTAYGNIAEMCRHFDNINWHTLSRKKEFPVRYKNYIIYKTDLIKTKLKDGGKKRIKNMRKSFTQ
jgi:hypothetical protein